MNDVIDLKKCLSQDEDGYHVRYTVNGVTLAVSRLNGSFGPEPTSFEVGYKVGKQNNVFIIDSQMADLPTIDADEPELLMAEMETLILRVEDLQQHHNPITEETLFAQELERLRSNPPYLDPRP